MIDRRIENTRAYIDSHFTQYISMEILSSVANLSPFHLSRLYSSLLGISITDYIQKKRIEYAGELLRSTDLSVLSISSEAGFNTLSNFNKLFKRRSGCTPAEFRKKQSIKKEEKRIIIEEEKRSLEHNYPITSFIRRIIEMNLKETILKDMRAAYVTQKGSYLETGALWQRLIEWAFPKGLTPPVHQYFGISYDEPEKADDEKISDACVVLPEGFNESDTSVLYKTVKGGLFLKYEFYDTSDRLGLVYKQVVTDYLPVSTWGLDTERDFLEFVMNDPFSDPEHRARIDLYIPVGKRTE
ncbi:MAG TPA: GyrI-like domain-containing protein [Treponemataceae bacterium]|nr:GyrI-like domain-containing protein [Treponemataceae bacterium]